MGLREKHDGDDDDSYDGNDDDNDDDGDDDSDDPKAVGDLCDQDLNQTSRQKQACLPPTYNEHNKQTICNRSKVNFVFSILEIIWAKDTNTDAYCNIGMFAYTCTYIYSSRYWKRLMSCRAKSGSEWMDQWMDWVIPLRLL